MFSRTTERTLWATLLLFFLGMGTLIGAPRYTVNSSADIRDGVIKNADVNASAAIDWSKINSGITITPSELNTYDPTGRSSGNVPTSDGAGGITWAAPSAGAETDPHSVHLISSGITGNSYIGTNAFGDIVAKTTPITSESDPHSFHLTGGQNTMGQSILFTSNESYDIGTAAARPYAVYGKYFGGDLTSQRFLAVVDSNNSVQLVNGNTSGIVDVGSSGTGGTLILRSNANPDVFFPTATTVGGAGGASALPATPLGYFTVRLNGTTTVKIPYYAN